MLIEYEQHPETILRFVFFFVFFNENITNDYLISEKTSKHLFFHTFTVFFDPRLVLAFAFKSTDPPNKR
jgi:hypothetical protein